MKVLVVNAGSSSIKYQVVDMTDESVLCKGLVDRVGIPGSTLEHKPAGKDEVVIKKDLPDHTAGMQLVLETLVSPEHGVLSSMDDIGAVGHRVVHGGEAFASSVVIDDEVKKVIRECFDIAPLHNPPNLMGIDACTELMPNVKHVAVFDTAFHQSMTPENFMYAVPYDAYEKFRVRRYGFHGTSHFFVAHRAAEMLGKPYEECKIITLHIGNGGSVGAIKDGRVIETSMGFTPLEGLVMGTRSGDIDPAVVFFLMDKLGMNTAEANNYFNKKAGLLGLSGVSNDLRDVEEAAREGNEKAQIALKVYHNRVKGYIGKYMALLNGCDCIVFTAGVGENGIDARAAICTDMDFLGIKMDFEKNKVRGKEVDVSAADSKVRIFIIPTNEELVIARDTYGLAK
ncbi:MAG: acetate kinase [Syntrophomonadaceae bacterium]|nr:acetate kinase [Syntrophomonadaceae bacterium]